MIKNVNLLEDSIFSSLLHLAIPIMLTSLLQMAYNMVDMIWIGKLGSSSLAAVGASGLYLMLANSFAVLAKLGGQIRVANYYGAKDYARCTLYATSTLHVTLIIAGIFSIVMALGTTPLVQFFSLDNATTISEAEIYLKIAGGLIFVQIFNLSFTSLIIATGNSKVPFIASIIGLLMNILLDPLFIFGYGVIPAMGVAGAAIATIIAQVSVMLIFILYLVKENQVFNKMKLFSTPHKKRICEMLKTSFPPALQGMFFTFIAMYVARMVSSWSDAAIAVQKVGYQIEAISWLTAEGFAIALSTFIAQNEGVKNHKRAVDGYKISLLTISVFGILTTLLLVFFAEPIFKIFITEPDVVLMGIDYLVILGYCQLFMCIEIVTSGAFAGYGNTTPPAILSVLSLSIRIPLAFFLSQTALGLNGIWWTISLSAILKGIFVLGAFFIYQKKLKAKKVALS